MTDTASERRALADRLEKAGVLTSPEWRAAVEAVPREQFLNPGVFLPGPGGRAAGSRTVSWSSVRTLPLPDRMSHDPQSGQSPNGNAP